MDAVGVVAHVQLALAMERTPPAGDAWQEAAGGGRWVKQCLAAANTPGCQGAQRPAMGEQQSPQNAHCTCLGPPAGSTTAPIHPARHSARPA